MRYDTLQIVQRLSPGGIEMLALRLAQTLPGRNAIVSLEGSPEQLCADWPAAAASNVDLFALGKAPGVSPAALSDLTRLLRRLAPRCVFTHHIGPLLYGGSAARLAGVPTLVHVEHDVWHHRQPRRRLQLRLARLALRPIFAAISPDAATTLGYATGARSVVVIPNGVDLGVFKAGGRDAARARLGLPSGTPVIGCVGRLEPVKNQAALLHALPRLDARVHAVLVGDGSQAAPLRALAAELGLAERVHFAGHRDDVPALYPAFDVLCLPSQQEGLPFVVVEAQACGIPVVATEVGAVRDALCPATSRLVPPGDVAALARALDDALRQPARESPRDFVTRFFDWDATVRRYTILAKG
ncbi:MAG: glycosyltransferase [Reyranellaceae bacterium]